MMDIVYEINIRSVIIKFSFDKASEKRLFMINAQFNKKRTFKDLKIEYRQENKISF